jgi:signal transduction histidine kinase
MLVVAIPVINVNSLFADDLWLVLVDRSLLESAILNLGFNARDTMPGGGILTIAARNIRLGVSGAASASDSVAISVTDGGIGMTLTFWNTHSSGSSRRRMPARAPVWD